MDLDKILSSFKDRFKDNSQFNHAYDVASSYYNNLKTPSDYRVESVLNILNSSVPKFLLNHLISISNHKGTLMVELTFNTSLSIEDYLFFEKALMSAWQIQNEELYEFSYFFNRKLLCTRGNNL